MTEFNYDGITAASYMDDPDVRVYLDKFFRDHHPDMTDETMIKAIVDRQFHQYPLILMLAECEKRLREANKTLAAAQSTNTTQDAKTAKEVTALKSDLDKSKAETKKALKEAGHYESKAKGLEAQISGLLKGQRT